MYEVTKEFTFSAAHILPRHPGKCQRLHGHNYRVQVTIESEGGGLDSQGMVVDFGTLKSQVSQILDTWDHRFLVALEALPEGLVVPDSMVCKLPIEETTAENLAGYLGLLLTERNDWIVGRVIIWETDTSQAIWRSI